MKSKFKKYTRIGTAEMRPVTKREIDEGAMIMSMYSTISISIEDIENGSPKEKDMIARNPEKHSDQWLVAGDYVKDNFKEV